MAGLKSAAAHLPCVDAIGGSSAGIIINNRPMIASLFRGVPKERFDEVRALFLRIRDEMGVPLEVINDGDVTALAGAMSLEDTGILGIALGSSEAAGYVDMQGNVTGWLSELAFAPVDGGWGSRLRPPACRRCDKRAGRIVAGIWPRVLRTTLWCGLRWR